MYKFLCLTLIIVATTSLQAVTIHTLINKSSQDAFIIAYTKPAFQTPTVLNGALIAEESALYRLESTVYLITRDTIAKKGDSCGPLQLGNDKKIIVSTSKGQTDIGPCDIHQLLIEKDGSVKIVYLGRAL